MRKPRAPRPPREEGRDGRTGLPTSSSDAGGGQGGGSVVPERAGVLEPAGRGQAVPRAGAGEPAGQRVPASAAGGLGVFSRRGPARQEALGPLLGARSTVVSTGLRDRLAERRRALRRLRWRRLARWAAVCALVAALVWVVAFSPLFALRSQQVVVSGSDGTVSVEQVRAVLARQEGRSLVRLDLRQTGREVADELVRVRSATVTRRWPHGVQVSLTMRVPVAVVQGRSGFDVLDGDAVVLESVETAPAGLVQVTLPASGSAEDSGQTDADGATGGSGAQDSSSADAAAQASVPSAQQVQAVASAAGALSAAVREQVVSGSASESGQVTLTLVSGATVVWGDTEDGALKAEVLQVLLGSPASVYDVSSPRSPTTR